MARRSGKGEILIFVCFESVIAAAPVAAIDLGQSAAAQAVQPSGCCRKQRMYDHFPTLASHTKIRRANTVSRRSAGALAAMLLLLDGGSGAATEYVSPDRAINVLITEGGAENCEATVRVNEDHAALLTLDYASPDHQHGRCVVMAARTPDSQFFVFSTESSGGHQPWHTPIMFFSRQEGRVLALETYVRDPITAPTFSLAAPDVITFTTTKVPLDPLSTSTPILEAWRAHSRCTIATLRKIIISASKNNSLPQNRGRRRSRLIRTSRCLIDRGKADGLYPFIFSRSVPTAYIGASTFG